MTSHVPFVRVGVACFALAVLVLALATFSASSLQLVALLVLAAVLVFAATTFATIAAAVVVTRHVTTAAGTALERRSDRLRHWALDLEATNPVARAVKLSELVAPLDRRTPEERAVRAVEEAKARYADGALTDAELERELARALELERTAAGRRERTPPRGSADRRLLERRRH